MVDDAVLWGKECDISWTAVLKNAMWTTAQFVFSTNKCHGALSTISNENVIFFFLYMLKALLISVNGHDQGYLVSS